MKQTALLIAAAAVALALPDRGGGAASGVFGRAASGGGSRTRGPRAKRTGPRIADRAQFGGVSGLPLRDPVFRAGDRDPTISKTPANSPRRPTRPGASRDR